MIWSRVLVTLMIFLRIGSGSYQSDVDDKVMLVNNRTHYGPQLDNFGQLRLQLHRVLFDSNCMEVGGGATPLYQYCVGCDTYAAQRCVDDMRSNVSHNVRQGCDLTSNTELRQPECCAKWDNDNNENSINRLTTAYNDALLCLENIGCGNTDSYREIEYECHRNGCNMVPVAAEDDLETGCGDDDTVDCQDALNERYLKFMEIKYSKATTLKAYKGDESHGLWATDETWIGGRYGESDAGTPWTDYLIDDYDLMVEQDRGKQGLNNRLRHRDIGRFARWVYDKTTGGGDPSADDYQHHAVIDGCMMSLDSQGPWRLGDWEGKKNKRHRRDRQRYWSRKLNDCAEEEDLECALRNRKKKDVQTALKKYVYEDIRDQVTWGMPARCYYGCLPTIQSAGAAVGPDVTPFLLTAAGAVVVGWHLAFS